MASPHFAARSFNRTSRGPHTANNVATLVARTMSTASKERAAKEQANTLELASLITTCHS